MSYGGIFRYKLSTQSSRGGEPQPLAEIIMHGNEITLEADIDASGRDNDQYSVAFREVGILILHYTIDRFSVSSKGSKSFFRRM